MDMNRSTFCDLAGFYRKHLIEDVIGFWEPRTADGDLPGFLVPFDRTGNLMGTDKNTWCQSRQTSMFASLYGDLERRPLWLALAERGRNMLVGPAHAGGGRWHYLLDREGRVINARGSLFADAFAISGLCQYALASGSDEDLPLIQTAFDTLERNLRTPGFNEFHHFQLNADWKYQAVRMVVVGMAPVLRAILGPQRIASLVDDCLHDILYVFARDEFRVLFEVLDGDGGVLHTDAGRTINPGHTLESMWFCIEEGRHRRDDSVVQRALQIADWAWENGHDREHGGMLAFTTVHGGKPPEQEAAKWTDETWDTKIWWVHSESLYTAALAAVVTGEARWWQRFEHLHEYTQKCFADHEYGEW
jgi:N-acylglucosamine 2-epimerase